MQLIDQHLLLPGPIYLACLTHILEALQSTDPAVTGGLRRDENMDAPFFNTFAADGAVTQYWFDDAASLSHKFQWARDNNLRGVGPYTFTYLDPNGRDADIWSTFDIFMHEDSIGWDQRNQR